jgi:hypothetical protein
VAKRKKPGKQSAKSAGGDAGPSREPHREPERPAIVPHPPQPNRALLAISILLFAMWFVFLLVTALRA